jgi:hypothetical protein
MVETYAGAVLQASYVHNGQGQRVKKVEATGDERTFVFLSGKKEGTLMVLSAIVCLMMSIVDAGL